MEDKERFKVLQTQNSSAGVCTVLCDSRTGIEYLLIERSNGCGLTPLLNRDGTPMFSEQTES